jgi:low affinity Fe/Cu permease
MSRVTSKRFASLASWLAKWLGSHWAVVAAALLIVIGLAVFGVDVTSIIVSASTLLMVIVLQNSQNRDSAALHLKLDEVITHLEGPRDHVAGIEEKTHEEIEELHEELGAAEDRSSTTG